MLKLLKSMFGPKPILIVLIWSTINFGATSQQTNGRTHSTIATPAKAPNPDNIYYFSEGETLTLKCLLAKPYLGKLVEKYRKSPSTLRRSFFWSINNYQYTAHDLEQDFSHIKLRGGGSLVNSSVEQQLTQFDLKISNVSAQDEGYYFCGLRRNHKLGSSGYISNVTQLVKIVPYGKPLIWSDITAGFLADGASLKHVIKPQHRSNSYSNHNDSSDAQQNIELKGHEKLTLSCLSRAGKPSGAVEWLADPGLKVRLVFSGRSRDSSSHDQIGVRGGGYEESRIEINGVGVADMGKKVTCRAKQISRDGHVIMSDVRSYVSLDVLYAPMIENGKGGEDFDQDIIYLREGGTLRTNCKSHGNPTPKITWWLSNKHGNFVVSDADELNIQNVTSRGLIGRQYSQSPSAQDNFGLALDDLGHPYFICQATNELGSTFSRPIAVRFDASKAPFTNWESGMSQKLMIILVTCTLIVALIITVICQALSKKRILFSRKFIDKKLPIVAKNEERYRVYNPHKSAIQKTMDYTPPTSNGYLSNGDVLDQVPNAKGDVQINVVPTPNNNSMSKFKPNHRLLKSKWEEDNSINDNSHLRRIHDRLNPMDASINHSIISRESQSTSPIVPLASVDSESFLNLSFEEVDTITRAKPTEV